MNKILLHGVLFTAIVLRGEGRDQSNPATPQALAERTSDISDSALRIDGIFDASLPGTERKHALRFIFHPHLGDLTKRDYLRVPMGLRYGFSKSLEVTGEINGYVSHGLGDVPLGQHYGFSDFHVGGKYNLGERIRRGWETAVGFDYIFPLGQPPVDLTDGLNHMSPYVSFSHRLESDPSWRLFWGTGVDFANKTTIIGKRQKNDLADDANSFTGGFVWDYGRAHYTLEASYATTRLIGDVFRDSFALRPGLLWEVPPRWTPTGHGRWLLGVGLKAGYGTDGADLGASMKVRVDFNLQRWWRDTFRKPASINLGPP